VDGQGAQLQGDGVNLRMDQHARIVHRRCPGLDTKA
jgi:hypothetical protein